MFVQAYAYVTICEHVVHLHCAIFSLCSRHICALLHFQKNEGGGLLFAEVKLNW